MCSMTAPICIDMVRSYKATDTGRHWRRNNQWAVDPVTGYVDYSLAPTYIERRNVLYTWAAFLGERIYAYWYVKIDFFVLFCVILYNNLLNTIQLQSCMFHTVSTLVVLLSRLTHSLLLTCCTRFTTRSNILTISSLTNFGSSC
ncbi:hypothetical protein GMOD_00003942 [Pyrenophora seminiperda CCB06]|uniref:Uncharacterized protein n=1 Tax=Pyrenophora seminiperda CCB06 TaxID=1302712 RepID=A0A3M7M046_9PLEO|nr:hypothetical protein GMOD_00003942 [Pyrenophora seminiperda CCB06]